MTQRLVFWQNMPSIHQAPLLREAARQWPGELLVVTEVDVSADRLAQGWERPDYSPARLLVCPSAVERRRLVRESTASDVHVFSGFHAYPETYCTLKQVSRTDATVGIMVERGREDDGYRAVLRRLRYDLLALRWRRRLRFLLATGALGVRWYQARGFPAERLLPFGYFVEPPSVGDADAHSAEAAHSLDDPVRVLFVGELAYWKGVDLLLRALAGARDMGWRLDVIGEGREAEAYRGLADTLGVAGRVRWLGNQPNAAVRRRMATADVLVLPSRYDGWGAVVNEALGAGTPVIVSDACGASDLVREGWRGRVVEARVVEALRAALEAAIARGPLPAAARARIRAWAEAAISPTAAAGYLLEGIRYAREGGARPTPPWRR